MCRPIARAAATTCWRSAEPSSPGGVPTATICSSPCATLAATSVEKRSRPACSFLCTMASRPGSKIGILPCFSRPILRSSRSRQNTELPASARQAPVTSPTYPVPTTVTFMRPSRGQFELLGAPRRIRLPAAARRAAPVELARLEAAGLAPIARQAPRMPVHEAAHELQISPLVGRAGGDDLRLEQAVEAEERRIALELLAHQPVGLLGAFRVEGLLEHGVEKVERRVALEVAGEERQAFLGASAFAVGLEQALRHEGEVRRVLRFDTLPVLHRLVQVALAFLEIAEQQARAHALAVRVQRRLEVAARRIRPRLRGFGGGQLAVVLGEVARVRLHQLGHLDGAVPILLLLVDLEEVAPRRGGLRAVLELPERLFGAVEDSGLEVVLAELGERDQLLLRAEARSVEEVLVHADRTVVLPAPAEQAAEREVQLDRLGVDLHHLDERLDRLVGLLVQQEVEALEVRARQRARLGHDLADVDARGDPAQAEEERKAEQPPVFELHGSRSSAASPAAPTRPTRSCAGGTRSRGAGAAPVPGATARRRTHRRRKRRRGPG